MKIKESRGRKIFKAFNYTFLALLGIATFYPFWYVLIASFNTGRDFMRRVDLAESLHTGELPDGI